MNKSDSSQIKDVFSRRVVRGLISSLKCLRMSVVSENFAVRRMDGLTDERTDGRIDGRTDG